MSIKVKLIMPS